jgi:hypothetical protein
VRQHLGLGQCINVGDDGGPGSVLAERGDAGLEFGLQYEGKEITKYVSANGLVELVEDQPGGEQLLCWAEVCSTAQSCL